MDFDTVTITDWNQLLDLEPEFGGWVYRGHSNASWDMESSLRRVVLNNQIGYTPEPEEDLFSYAERASLRSFKSRAHFYLSHLPQSEDLAAWLAVMQHHGAPTRLLDFSYSLYVACYFALMNATTDSCVWAIDDGWLRSEGTRYACNMGIEPTNSLRFGELASISQAANAIISSNNFDATSYVSPEPAVLMIEIDRQIPRLAIQQGIFLMPTDLQSSFVFNLESMDRTALGSRQPIMKIIFPHKIRDHGLMHLRMMNITAESLFPGIDGFAASLVQQDML